LILVGRVVKVVKVVISWFSILVERVVVVVKVVISWLAGMPATVANSLQPLQLVTTITTRYNHYNFFQVKFYLCLTTSLWMKKYW
jgi:hypothetical protein